MSRITTPARIKDAPEASQELLPRRSWRLSRTVC